MVIARGEAPGNKADSKKSPTTNVDRRETVDAGDRYRKSIREDP